MSLPAQLDLTITEQTVRPGQLILLGRAGRGGERLLHQHGGGDRADAARHRGEHRGDPGHGRRRPRPRPARRRLPRRPWLPWEWCPRRSPRHPGGRDPRRSASGWQAAATRTSASAADGREIHGSGSAAMVTVACSAQQAAARRACPPPWTGRPRPRGGRSSGTRSCPRIGQAPAAAVAGANTPGARRPARRAEAEVRAVRHPGRPGWRSAPRPGQLGARRQRGLADDAVATAGSPGQLREAVTRSARRWAELTGRSSGVPGRRRRSGRRPAGWTARTRPRPRRRWGPAPPGSGRCPPLRSTAAAAARRRGHRRGDRPAVHEVGHPASPDRMNRSEPRAGRGAAIRAGSRDCGPGWSAGRAVAVQDRGPQRRGGLADRVQDGRHQPSVRDEQAERDVLDADAALGAGPPPPAACSPGISWRRG